MDEDPIVTKRWLQVLEDVHARRVMDGGPIKKVVKNAISITTNSLVKIYLRKAMRKWKANSAEFTKQSVIWLTSCVKEARPDLEGRKVSDETVTEHKKKVINEGLAMEHLEDDTDVENAEDIS